MKSFLTKMACIVIFIAIVSLGFCRISLAAKESYKIGAIFSVTGPASWLGEPERNTAKMIVDQINATGGINGHPLELIVYDTEGDETKAVLNAKKLIEKDNVLAIIGPSCSGPSLAIIPTITKAQVPNISCAAAASIVSPVKKWVFKTPQSDVFCAEVMYEYMKTKGITKVAIISVSSGFGDNGRQELLKASEKMGIKVVADERYGGKDTDMTAQLTKIKGTDAQAIINWSIGPTQVIVTKNVSQLGIKIPLFQSHGFGNTKNIEQAGGSAESVLAPIGRLLVADVLPSYHYHKSLLMNYNNEYKAKFGAESSTFGGHAYDAMHILIAALSNVGPDRVKIRDYVENMRGFIGTAGIFNFSPDDHNGLTKDSFEMLKVKGPRFVLAD